MYRILRILGGGWEGQVVEDFTHWTSGSEEICKKSCSMVEFSEYSDFGDSEDSAWDWEARMLKTTTRGSSGP